MWLRQKYLQQAAALLYKFLWNPFQNGYFLCISTSLPACTRPNMKVIITLVVQDVLDKMSSWSPRLRLHMRVYLWERIAEKIAVTKVNEDTEWCRSIITSDAVKARGPVLFGSFPKWLCLNSLLKQWSILCLLSYYLWHHMLNEKGITYHVNLYIILKANYPRVFQYSVTIVGDIETVKNWTNVSLPETMGCEPLPCCALHQRWQNHGSTLGKSHKRGREVIWISFSGFGKL